MTFGDVLLGERTLGGCFTSRKFFCDVVNMGRTIILGPLSVPSATTGSGRDTVGWAMVDAGFALFSCACADFATLRCKGIAQPAAASMVLRLEVLFLVFLPLVCCQGLPPVRLCLPRVVLSTSVHATARVSEQLACSDGYREFRDLLKAEVSAKEAASDSTLAS